MHVFLLGVAFSPSRGSAGEALPAANRSRKALPGAALFVTRLLLTLYAPVCQRATYWVGIFFEMST